MKNVGKEVNIKEVAENFTKVHFNKSITLNQNMIIIRN